MIDVVIDWLIDWVSDWLIDLMIEYSNDFLIIWSYFISGLNPLVSACD